jgi:coproporphyrinogen III oxidase
VSAGSDTDARRAAASAWIATIHDDLTALFESLDGGARFREDTWEREGGGGGWSRVMIDGVTFEKAGINRSTVLGVLPPAAAARLGGPLLCHGRVAGGASA